MIEDDDPSPEAVQAFVQLGHKLVRQQTPYCCRLIERGVDRDEAIQLAIDATLAAASYGIRVGAFMASRDVTHLIRADDPPIGKLRDIMAAAFDEEVPHSGGSS